MAVPVSVSTHLRAAVESFELVSTAPGAWSSPAEASFAGALTAQSTVAAALARNKRLDLSSPPDLDGGDHWFRARLPKLADAPRTLLVFEGLATLADVWLDGEHLLRSENMFRRHEVDVTGRAKEGSELVIRFASLTKHLAQRRPRPRWRTRIVDQQQLRFVRTSLIGRTPGFCPRVPVVGPYREVRLEAQARLAVKSARLRTSLDDTRGTVELELAVEALGSDAAVQRGTLVIEGAAGRAREELAFDVRDRVSTFKGRFTLAEIALWWPHTHGEQPRSTVRVLLENGVNIELGKIAFRSLVVDRGADGQGFGIVINGEPVFCRGACWTTDDLLTLGSVGLEHTLRLVCDAGMNMLRIPGITAYESDRFYELCDALGILVFQDFMFANMDYPAQDPAFLAEVTAEASELIARIGARPSLAVLCGSSEVEQQVAMMGMSRELWHSALFHELLPKLIAEQTPQVPYVSSSPTGGELPFQVDSGLAHYYGVGAYLRPLEDARRSDVRFASECLAFANVPERETIESFMRDLEMPFHHPRWKERVPRDRGVGWDFEDVRDHYVRELFGVDFLSLRYADPERYLALSRAVVSAVVESTFHEWRRTGSRCRGALVFWLKDVWAGAGWGVLDAYGVPKSPYYAMKRALAPIALLVTDEGLNGVVLHAINDTAHQVPVALELTLYRAGEVVVSKGERALELAPRETRALVVDGLFDRFVDSAYAYRFGPAAHDLVVACLRRDGQVIARAFHEPMKRLRPQELELGLSACWSRRGDELGVLVSSRRFAQYVNLDIDGYVPDDNYFHLEPGGERLVRIAPRAGTQGAPRGVVSALNALSTTAIVEATKVR